MVLCEDCWEFLAVESVKCLSNESMPNVLFAPFLLVHCMRKRTSVLMRRANRAFVCLTALIPCHHEQAPHLPRHHEPFQWELFRLRLRSQKHHGKREGRPGAYSGLRAVVFDGKWSASPSDGGRCDPERSSVSARPSSVSPIGVHPEAERSHSCQIIHLFRHGFFELICRSMGLTLYFLNTA